MTVRIPFKKSDFYFDGYLNNNLGIIKKQINEKDMDMVGIIDGYEGVGKSVLAQQIAYNVDPTLNLSRIVFSPEEYKNAVLKGKRGQAIIWDEAITGSFNREAIQRMNVLVIKMMAQVRQMNLFILIVLPTFYDLDRNLALFRTKFLIHTHFGNEFERGFFKFASMDKKKQMYLKYQKQYYYPKSNSHWSFKGRFVKQYIVNEKEYRAKKLKSFKESDYEQISLRRVRLQRDAFIVYLNNLGYTQEEIAEVSDIFSDGVTQQAINLVLKKHYKLQLTTSLIKLKSKYENKEEKVSQVTQEKTGPQAEHEHLNDDFLDDELIRKSIIELRDKKVK